MVVFVNYNIHNAMTLMCEKLGCTIDQGFEFAAIEWIKSGYRHTLDEAKRIDKLKGETNGTPPGIPSN